MTCNHERNCGIAMPSRDGGGQSNAVPFIWCRNCGAIWLPKQRSFDRAFEHHEKQECQAPVEGIGNVNGYWVLPGIRAVIIPS